MSPFTRYVPQEGDFPGAKQEQPGTDFLATPNKYLINIWRLALIGRPGPELIRDHKTERGRIPSGHPGSPHTAVTTGRTRGVAPNQGRIRRHRLHWDGEPPL